MKKKVQQTPQKMKIENPKGTSRKQLKFINEFGRVAGYNINI